MKAKTEKLIRDEFHKKLMPYMTLWKKLNQGQDYVRIIPPKPKTKSSSVVTFLLEEYCNGILLVQSIHKCFTTIKKIIKGNIRLEDEDFQLSNDLICHRVS